MLSTIGTAYNKGPWQLTAAVGAATAAFAVGYHLIVANAWTPSPYATRAMIEADGGHTLELSNKRVMEYFFWGDQTSDTVVVALHGAQTTGKLFQLLDEWGKAHKVKIVAPTLPGYGYTSHHGLPAQQGLKQTVVELSTLLQDTLKLKKFHVAGTSLGGIYAAALAGMYPDPTAVGNVLLYVSFAPTSDNDDQAFDPFEGSMLAPFNIDHSPWRKRFMDMLIILPLLRLMGRGKDLGRSLKWQWEGAYGCSSLINTPWPYEWRKLASRGQSRKVVVISALKDKVCSPANQHRLCSNIPGSTLVEFDGEHDTPLNDTRLFCEHFSLVL